MRRISISIGIMTSNRHRLQRRQRRSDNPHKSERSQKHTEFWARFHWSCWHWVWFWWGCWWFWRSWSSCRSRLLHHIFCDRRRTRRLSTGSLSCRKRIPLSHHDYSLTIHSNCSYVIMYRNMDIMEWICFVIVLDGSRQIWQTFRKTWRHVPIKCVSQHNF